MSNPFVAEIRIFGFNFPPIGWAFCNGQLMPITQNTALFSLLGTTYGGDGRSTFQLPNMQGNAPMHPGQGPGLSLHDLGETGGSETVALLPTEMPVHGHPVTASASQGLLNTPSPTNGLARSKAGDAYVTQTPQPPPLVQMNANTIVSNGGSQPHNNLMPYLALNFCIALQGVFPPRT
jgi:microcystin-dependent protein